MNYFDNIVGTEHNVAESSKLRATHPGGGHIYSVKLDKDRDNGTIISKGSYVAADVYNAADYTSGQMLLLLTPPLAYNTAMKDYSAEKYFYNAKDEEGRAYEVFAGDVFTVSAKGFSTVPDGTKVYASWDATNQKYVAQANKAAIAGTSPAAQFSVIETVNYQNSVSYRLELL